MQSQLKPAEGARRTRNLLPNLHLEGQERGIALLLCIFSLLLLTGIVHPPLQAQMIANRGSGSAASIGQSLAMISMIATVFRAVGFGLLI